MQCRQNQRKVNVPTNFFLPLDQRGGGTRPCTSTNASQENVCDVYEMRVLTLPLCRPQMEVGSGKALRQDTQLPSRNAEVVISEGIGLYRNVELRDTEFFGPPRMKSRLHEGEGSIEAR